jgi:hypothetical protein
MWKLISGYVLAVYTMKKAASYATFEHNQAAFTGGKHLACSFHNLSEES